MIGSSELADSCANPFYFKPSHVGYVWPAWMLSRNEHELADAVTPLEVRLDSRERSLRCFATRHQSEKAMQPESSFDGLLKRAD